MGGAVFDFDTAVRHVKEGDAATDVAAKLLAELTDEECLWLLDGDTPFWSGLKDELTQGYNRKPYIHGEVKRLGIPGLRFSDGPRGATMGTGGTAFPVSTARGATWDVALEEQVGIAIGREVRIKGCNLFGGVCINLPRHPAWGRIQECYGEGPILLGEFGAALTRGSQRHVMACVKHFALNSMENARFRAWIEEGVVAVMSSYNSVNGEWAGQNRILLTDILRNGWGFKGYVISDFVFGSRDAALSVKNGLDVEAPFRQLRATHLPEALTKGTVTMVDVRAAGRRILASQLQHASRRESTEPEASLLFSREHRALARTVAARSMVLLKNDTIDGHRLLPLKKESISRCAVIGRLANAANTGDQGTFDVHNPEVTSPFMGIKAALPQAQVTLSDSDEIDDAVKAASSVDAVILIVGFNAGDEGEYMVPSLKENPELLKLFPPPDGSESAKFVGSLFAKASQGKEPKLGPPKLGVGGDRKSIQLRPRDVELIKDVVAVNPRTIVTMVTAGAVITEEWRHDVSAIVVSWYSGCEGGHALADVLFGDVDASGRLPFSIPISEQHLPFFDRNTPTITYDRWFGQRLLDKLGVEAAYPLGWGMSYSSFSLSDLKIHVHPSLDSLTIDVMAHNTGAREGRHVVQIYGKQRYEQNDFPSRVLLGFAVADIEAGQSLEVRAQASMRPLQRWISSKFILPNQNIDVEVGGYAGDPSSLRKALTEVSRL